MQLSSIVGLLLGAGVFFLALSMAGVPIHSLFYPEVILIVFGGTLAAILAGFSTQGLFSAMKGLIGSLTQPKLSAQACVADLADMASFIRRDGVLAIEPLLEDIPYPLARQGMQMVIDNRKPYQIRESLSTQIEVTYRDMVENARVFEAAGGFAPTMGIIGAMIGLIQTIHTYQDPSALTHGIAGAFSATLLGVALANLILLPMATRLKKGARETWFKNTLIMEGIMSIQSGEHPFITEEKLSAFLRQVSGQPAQANQGLNASSDFSQPTHRPSQSQQIAETHPEWDETLHPIG